jgi:hypothetical protein
MEPILGVIERHERQKTGVGRWDQPYRRPLALTTLLYVFGPREHRVVPRSCHWRAVATRPQPSTCSDMASQPSRIGHMDTLHLSQQFIAYIAPIIIAERLHSIYVCGPSKLTCNSDLIASSTAAYITICARISLADERARHSP